MKQLETLLANGVVAVSPAWQLLGAVHTTAKES